MSNCPFCERIASGTELVSTTERSASLLDSFPSSEGHTLVVPLRHVARVEDLEHDEWTDLFELVRVTAKAMGEESKYDGLNIGVNSGVAAGQTVQHAHVHIIPREVGDAGDPRGGVRWVLPETADYWTDS